MIPFLHHPDVQRNWGQWSEDQTLHVAAVYTNPFRWRTRRELANAFRRHMMTSANVVLHFGEVAFGDRPHEVTGEHPGDLQFRSTTELFLKENGLNQIIARGFPANWKYGAWIDADFHFTRHDWALEAIHQLQHYSFVQLFSSYSDLGGGIYGQKDLPLRAHSSFFFNYIQNGYKVSPSFANGSVKTGKRDASGYEESALMRGVGATGGAFAFTRSAFDSVGGLLDRCILGHADWYMSYSLLDIEPPDIHTQDYHPHYKHYVNAWRDRARVLRKNVGYVDGFALHHFHGSKTRRAYSSRDVILARHQYSPYEDVHPDYHGILQLNANKPDFRDDVRRYMISRSEDDPNVYGSEKPLV